MTSRHRLLFASAAVLAPAALAALAWRYTDLSESFSAQSLVDWIANFSGYWWAPLVIILLHTPASIVMFPRPILTVAAVVVFGLWKGFAYSMLGVLIATVLFYYAGILLQERTVQRIAGRRVDRLTRLLRRRGTLAITAIRLMPIAPFVVESVLAGALRARLFDVMAGTFLGMLPGMLGTTVVGDQIAAALMDDRQFNAWIVIAVVLAFVALTWFSKRWLQRLEAA